MENIMYKATVCLLILLTASSFAQDASRRTNTTALAPRIVATVSLTGQTAGIAKTALFTPTNDGLFRVSAYMTMTVPMSTGFWRLNAFWTDDAGAEENVIYYLFSGNKPPTAACNTPDVGGPSCNSAVLLFHDKAGVPLSYDVEAHAGAAGTYDVFIVVEQLM